MYRQIVMIEVLSAEPLEHQGVCSLSALAYRLDEGDCVGSVMSVHTESVSRTEMAESLFRLGSEPGFFMIEPDEQPAST